MAKSYKEKLKDITTFIFDVDGVFTDGSLYLVPGEMARVMNVKDGFAVQLAVKKGLRLAIITGGNSELVKSRLEGLGIPEVYLSCHDKMAVFQEYLKKHNLDASEVCYMGDDIPDYDVMKIAGLSVAPHDACAEVKSVSHYISDKDGGKGCVRDILEQAMKVKGLWMKGTESHQW
jgi:3-deoxy-D-manno-octulosonate 8-phosphate phosphatase (KDO 8-P phosphatase)